MQIMALTSNFSDTCTIKNTSNGAEVEVELLDFRPKERLTVSVNRTVKVTLVYQARTNIYVGNMAGLEFTSTGPKETQTYKGR